ncbi:hypothetical protein NJH24_14040 [Pseudomonas asiatica]|uniref:hypothetical protein n=1 Tax=Pseudomonas asiatica TaxID=2219225 RepID=UPI00209BB713|nr:hypothetical protein [Pseudomonas asiatica]MCO7535894.1 hypothetical protein [Pseudomonas asiatica]MCO7549658.1 hypothetical protein [Pseudomonas asiatica]MCO7560207.1 hypothetical protein [Pseudomonas asiatica]
MSLEFVEYLGLIPSTVWSGIVAASSALAGVLISNHSSHKRLEMQLKHDASEKAKDKISNLRKEVYLKAIEDISSTYIHMSTIASRDLTKTDLNAELHTITASMEKLKIVAEPETAKVAEDLSQAYGVLVLNILPKMVPLQDAQSDIQINDDLYNKSFADASRILQQMHSFTEEARQDIVVFQALQRSYEWFSNQSQEYADARAAAYDQRNERLLEFNRDLLPRMKELSKIQLKLTACIRNELSLFCDVADMERRLERTWAVMEAGYSDAMKGLQAELGDSKSHQGK